MTKTQTTGTTCRRCHAQLRSAKSVAAGIGPVCARRARQERAVTGIKPNTIAKAQELIEQGGIIPVRGRRVFRAVSSDGQRTYLTAPQACTCAAGLKSKHMCLHRTAATILAA